MRYVEPNVRLIAKTEMLEDGLADYLYDIGAGDYGTDAQSESEALIEAAGRICYRAWKPGLNANVTKVREGNEAYIGNILAHRHGSVLEHAQVSFIFQDVSRVLTHEIVRHRVGCAVSQESMRYVAITDIPFWVPSCFVADPDPIRHRLFMEDQHRLLREMEEFQVRWRRAYGLDDEGVEFARKKEVTSGLRRWAPQGIATSMVWSANLRTLRHVIELRTDPSAEEEVRLVFDQVARIAIAEFPSVFQDFSQADPGTGAWVPRNSKV